MTESNILSLSAPQQRVLQLCRDKIVSMNQTLFPLVGMTNERFDRVYKPSTMLMSLDNLRRLTLMFYAPIEDETGEVMAFSLDSNGNCITESTFREMSERFDASHYDVVKLTINTVNDEISSEAKAVGLTATMVYELINAMDA